MRRFGVLALWVLSAQATASDLGVELSTQGTRPSEERPSTGAAGVTGSGSYDFSDAWNAGASVGYTRSFASHTPETQTSGSDVFLLSASVLWTPTEHWSLLAAGNLSPPSKVRTATVASWQLARRSGTTDLVLRSEDVSGGGLLLGSWSSASLDFWSHAVDGLVSVTDYGVFQQAELPATARAQALETACTGSPRTKLCQLIGGVHSPLLQVKVGATYTATLAQTTDLALEANGYLYDRDPSSVGYFNLVALGREVGAGVATTPWAFTSRVSAAHRFERWSLKASYQLGVYVNGGGTNHLVALKASVKLTPKLKLSLLVTGQLDVGTISTDETTGAVTTGPSNLGGSAVLGLTALF
jgi:hypothetical protein